MPCDKSSVPVFEEAVTDHRLYTCWKHMIQRCTNESNPKYPRYGGRGIEVCERWIDKETGFNRFCEDMGPMPIGLSIERIDNDKGYSPDNCRWATPLEQSNNVNRNIWIEYNGQRKTSSQWARELGLYTQQIQYRYHAGWSSSCILRFTNHIRGSCPHCEISHD